MRPPPMTLQPGVSDWQGTLSLWWQERRQKKSRGAPPRPSKFRLETLEQRLYLSTTLPGIDPALTDQIVAPLAATVLVLDQKPATPAINWGDDSGADSAEPTPRADLTGSQTDATT